MHCHYSRDGKSGWRGWLHFGDRSCFHGEVNWWTHFCHAYISSDDEGWTLSVALPPLAIWIVLDDPRLWLPTKVTRFSWETPPRDVRLPVGRECKLSIYNWTISITPWGKTMEWSKGDPWYVRGWSLNIPNLILGRQRCQTEIVRSFPTQVPMPEGVYAAVAKVERRTWKRPRWFAHSRDSVWLTIPKGIPHAGKGENSWDCGDDGLFGIGGDSLENAIGNAVESVLRARRRYGHASQEAITEALKGA